MISFPANRDKNNENEVFYSGVQYLGRWNKPETVPAKIFHQEYIAPSSFIKEPESTFQDTMKWTILIGQCFGVNPVLGIWDKDVSKLRFSVYSARCLFSIISAMGQIMLMLFCIFKLFKEANASISSNTAVVFYFCNGLITLLFFRVAREWPELVRHITKIEEIDPTEDTTIAMKCNVSVAVIIGVGAVEHFLADLSGVTVAKACQPDLNPYEAYLVQNFYWIWSYIPYNIFYAFAFKILNLQCTFNWNYSDVFVICLCWYLTARLRQINDRLVAVRGQYVLSSFWRTMREDYTKATSLVRKVDEVISGVVFVSFASNLFSICFLLLHVMEEGLRPIATCSRVSARKPIEGYVHTAYYGFAMIFIVVRSLAVSLIAARVHSVSTMPAHTLYEVPSSAYCVEVQRFLEQVHGDSVTLSGLQFFNVKRGMVLTIAATIVTYELVLIQFTGVSPTGPTPSPQPIIVVNGTL